MVMQQHVACDIISIDLADHWQKLLRDAIWCRRLASAFNMSTLRLNSHLKLCPNTVRLKMICTV